MKPDYAHTLTDKKIAELEKKLQKEYSQAVKDIEKKMADYMRRFEKKDKTWQRWVKEGKKTNAEYIQWRKGQMVAGRRWGQLKDKIAKDCSNVNQIARGIINGDVAGVYALNMNYATFQIEKGLGVNTSFSQYSQETVERLMAQNPDMLPPPGKTVSDRIRQGKDIRWNKQTIQSVATQGIIQGESIPAIAHRLAYAVGDSNYKAAIRNARTMCTGAQNAGRIDAHDRARAMGCRIDDYWMAVHDNRTRSSHRELDMEKRGEDGYFSNGCRYPGDPDGEPAEVYNCFIGETIVSSDSDIEKSYCHEYEGKLITIKTASGIEFTCTPNHPILSMVGWVRADAFDKGDDIIIALPLNNRPSRVNPNVNHIHSRIDAIHEFSDKLFTKRVSGLRVDFHGYVPTSDVEVITHKGFLRKSGDPCIIEQGNKLSFKHTDSFAFRGSHFAEGFLAVLIASLCGMCRRCKTLPFLRRCLRHAEEHGLRPIAWCDSDRFKPTDNKWTGNVEIFRECLDGFAGIIFADKVVDVNVKFSHCDVYNLQTKNGYYFVNPIISQKEHMFNGIGVIAHNCRCTILGIPTGFEEGYGIDADPDIMGMSYDEWLKAKPVSKPILSQVKKSKAIKQRYINEYRRR